jgi:hypothetical protein
VSRTPAQSSAGARWGKYGASMTLGGCLLSGPFSLWLVNATHPQPDWQGAQVFVEHAHPLQTLPFFLGFFLVGGFVVLLASLAASAPDAERAKALTSLVLTAAFAALVVLNYIIQTTFVPLLAQHQSAENAPILAALTMSNPESLGWCLEMWAYGVLGVATWLAADLFGGSRVERAARWAFVANGPVSLGSAFATAWIPGWVLTTPGLFAFGAWNLLVVVMAGLSFMAFRARGHASG